MKENWKLSEEALACTLWGTHFRRYNGPVVRCTRLNDEQSEAQ